MKPDTWHYFIIGIGIVTIVVFLLLGICGIIFPMGVLVLYLASRNTKCPLCGHYFTWRKAGSKLLDANILGTKRVYDSESFGTYSPYGGGSGSGEHFEDLIVERQRLYEYYGCSNCGYEDTLEVSRVVHH